MSKVIRYDFGKKREEDSVYRLTLFERLYRWHNSLRMPARFRKAGINHKLVNGKPEPTIIGRIQKIVKKYTGNSPYW